MMLNTNPDVAYGLIVAVFVSVLPMYLVGHWMIPFSSQIIRLPDAALTAVILTISIVGMRRQKRPSWTGRRDGVPISSGADTGPGRV